MGRQPPPTRMEGEHHSQLNNVRNTLKIILNIEKDMWETTKRNSAYSTHNNRFGVGEASAMELRSPIAHGKLGDLRLASGVSLKLGQMAHGWNKDHGSFQGRTERIEIMMKIADRTVSVAHCRYIQFHCVLCPWRSGVVASRNMTMAASMTMKMLIMMMLLMITTKMIAPASASISHLSPVQCQGCFQGCLSKWERCPGMPRPWDVMVGWWQ